MAREDNDVIDDKPMPLLEHLAELRRRLLWSAAGLLIAFLVCYHFSFQIYAFIAHPLVAILKSRGEEPRLIYTQLYEAFFTYIKVSLYAALFVSFPIISTQIWMFIAPGLYRSEKKALLPFIVATPVLFLAGAALAYYFIFPTAFRFFLSFQTPTAHPAADGMQIELMARVSDYLGLVMKLVFAFGVAFELPVALTLMGKVENAQAVPALCLCGLFRGCRRADAAGCADPDWSRGTVDRPVRNFHPLRPAGRAEARRGISAAVRA